MTRFISPVNQTLRSLSGCSVGFVAGQPTYVPPQAEVEALAIGCIVEGAGPQPDIVAETVQANADAAAAVLAEVAINAATA